MKNTAFKVYLKDGRIPETLFSTIQEAFKVHGVKNILRVDEVPVGKGNKTIIAPNKDLALVISMRSEQDLHISLDCGYAVTYNCPSYKKIYPGMPYFETSEKWVLEGKILKLARYDKLIHHHWKGPGLHPEKEWKWSIFHTQSVIISRDEAEAKYGKFSGVQGGIGYHDVSRHKENK
jgi:hypothetical protein